jgi:hypothetical protein
LKAGVKPFGSLALEEGIRRAVRAHADHDVCSSEPPLDERRDHLGRVLQIRVDHNGRIPARAGKAGTQRGFLAEVAAQINDDDARVAAAGLQKKVQRPVPAAVIDADDLKSCGHSVHNRPKGKEEDGDHLFFVEHWHNDRHQRLALHSSPVGLLHHLAPALWRKRDPVASSG